VDRAYWQQLAEDRVLDAEALLDAQRWSAAYMDTNPLVTEEIDAAAELIRRFHEYMPVEVAFWINPADEGRWALYIASDKIDDSSLRLGYGEVLRLVLEMRTPHLNPFQIRPVGVKDPLAQAALKVNRRYPGPTPNRVRGSAARSIGVEEMYIYPSQIIAAVK